MCLLICIGSFVGGMVFYRYFICDLECRKS